MRRAFSNPQIYPGIPAITSGINRLREECVRNCLSVSGDSYLLSVHFIPLVHYCPGVRTFGSTPTHRLHLARPPFLSSCQSVCLSFLSSRSVPVPAGLADQEPGLPWQPVLSPSLDGSSPDCVPSFTTPQKCTPRTCTAARGYRRVVTFFISDSFPIIHSLKLQSQHFSLPRLPPFTPRSRFTWVSQVRKLTLWVSAEADEMSLYVQFKWRYSAPCLCGICHTSSSAGRNHSPQRRTLTCRHLCHREMNRFPESDRYMLRGWHVGADWIQDQEWCETLKTLQNSARLQGDGT